MPDQHESFHDFVSREYPWTTRSVKTALGSLAVSGGGEILNNDLMVNIGLGIAVGVIAVLTPIIAYRETRR